MFVRSRRGGVCWFGFMKRCLCFAWRNPGSLSLCKNDCHPTLCEQVLHELVFIRLLEETWLHTIACFCVFLIYLNFLFYYLFTILSHITIQYLQTYNTYILLDGLVCSIMRYFYESRCILVSP